MPKKIYKYATGDNVPEGAIFLSTVVQTRINKGNGYNNWSDCYLVWHYFLVETDE